MREFQAAEKNMATHLGVHLHPVHPRPTPPEASVAMNVTRTRFWWCRWMENEVGWDGMGGGTINLVKETRERHKSKRRLERFPV